MSGFRGREQNRSYNNGNTHRNGNKFQNRNQECRPGPSYDNRNNMRRPESEYDEDRFGNPNNFGGNLQWNDNIGRASGGRSQNFCKENPYHSKGEANKRNDYDNRNGRDSSDFQNHSGRQNESQNSDDRRTFNNERRQNNSNSFRGSQYSNAAPNSEDRNGEQERFNRPNDRRSRITWYNGRRHNNMNHSQTSGYSNNSYMDTRSNMNHSRSDNRNDSRRSDFDSNNSCFEEENRGEEDSFQNYCRSESLNSHGEYEDRDFSPRRYNRDGRPVPAYEDHYPFELVDDNQPTSSNRYESGRDYDDDHYSNSYGSGRPISPPISRSISRSPSPRDNRSNDRWEDAGHHNDRLETSRSPSPHRNRRTFQDNRPKHDEFNQNRNRRVPQNPWGQEMPSAAKCYKMFMESARQRANKQYINKPMNIKPKQELKVDVLVDEEPFVIKDYEALKEACQQPPPETYWFPETRMGSKERKNQQLKQAASYSKNRDWMKGAVTPTNEPSFLWKHNSSESDESVESISPKKLDRLISRKDFVDNNVRFPCVFCGAKHYADFCPEVTNIDERRELLLIGGKCTKCLGSHEYKKCRREGVECRYCHYKDPNVEPHNSCLCKDPTTVFPLEE